MEKDNKNEDLPFRTVRFSAGGAGSITVLGNADE
jgi:hypothetical protein